jgi:hypothetical protein
MMGVEGVLRIKKEKSRTDKGYRRMNSCKRVV